MPVREFLDRSLDPHVSGYLHEPESPNVKGLILSHGAGSNANAPLLIALAETFCERGFTVLRCDLPYRQTRSFGPPGPADAARDRAGLKNAVTVLRKILGKKNRDTGAPLVANFAGSGNFRNQNERSVGTIFLAGHSYGGRQSSMLCAEDPDFVSGLVLLSYPLHPPRKPEQQRTQHLPNLRTPTLLVSGTRDPFGSIPEFGQAIKMIPANTKMIAIEGAGHDLGFKGKTKKEELPNQIFSEFTSFFGTSQI